MRQNAIILCTHDSGVFDTTLSHEYTLAESRAKLIALAQNGLSAAFVDTAQRLLLTRRFATMLHGPKAIFDGRTHRIETTAAANFNGKTSLKD